jgi:hypothetical protein
MDATIHTTLDEIPSWDEVSAFAGFYSSAGWLRLVHQPGTHYIAVRKADTVLGVMSCFLARGNGILPAYSDPAHLLLGVPDDRRVPDDLLYPVLFCGAVRGYSNRLLVRTELDGATRTQVLGLLLAQVQGIARREAARLVAFGYLPAAEAKELADLDDRLRPVFAESECFAGPLVSFDDHLAQMRSHRRNQTRRQLRRFAGSGLRIDQRRLPEVKLPLAELIAGHERHHGSPCTTQEVVDDFELRIALGLEDKIRVFCAWQGETLVGSTLFFVHGRTYYSREFGGDFQVPRDAGLYFNCTFYEPMRAAFEAGMTEIHYGLAALDAKVWRGCHVRPLVFVLGPSGPWPAEVHQVLVAAARARLDAEATILRQYHDEPDVRRELALDVVEPLLAR